MSASEVATNANITCPNCGFTKEEEMPTGSCQFFYECSRCGEVLKPKGGDCCVFCSYADKQCPSMQLEESKSHV